MLVAYGSETSGHRRRLRLPRENVDDWNFDGFSSKTPIETSSFRRNIFQLKIADEQEVERFYVTRFEDLQITACTLIANTFIKVLEPKKFLFFPYSKGNISAPPWWPATKSVRHREPPELLENGKNFSHSIECIVELTNRRTNTALGPYSTTGYSATSHAESNRPKHGPHCQDLGMCHIRSIVRLVYGL